MLARAARKVSVFLARHKVIDSEDLEVYVYSVEILLASSIIWFFLGAMAVASGTVIPSIFYFLGFHLMRSVAGGYHATNHLRCTILTVATYGAFIWAIGVLTTEIDKPLTGILILTALICTWYYAPMDSANKPFSPAERQQYQQKSRIMVTLLGLLMLLGLLAGWERQMLCLSIGTAKAALSVAVARHLERGSEHYEKSII